MVAALSTICSKIKMISAVLSIVRQMRERPDSVDPKKNMLGAAMLWARVLPYGNERETSHRFIKKGGGR